jgi:membrane associated rhomboid family serine protease
MACLPIMVSFLNYFLSITDYFIMSDINNSVAFKRSLVFASILITLLWLIKAYELLFETSLGFLGIYPMTLKGTIGIFTSPLIHGDPFHLLSNTFPLIMLVVGLFYFYHRIAFKVFALIYILTGIGVWLVARNAYHIGASGIIYGIMAFLFFVGLFNKDNKSMVVSLIVLFLYGGMIAGFFPSDQKVSYESHLMGAFSGVIAAFLFRNKSMESPNVEVKNKDDENEENGFPDYSPPSHTHNTSKIEFKIHYKENKKS